MKQFYTVKDVMRILQVKEAKAYKIIRKLNEELEQFKKNKGKIEM